MDLCTHLTKLLGGLVKPLWVSVRPLQYLPSCDCHRQIPKGVLHEFFANWCLFSKVKSFLMDAAPYRVLHGWFASVFLYCASSHFFCHYVCALSFRILCVVVEAASIGALSFPCYNGQDTFLSLLVLCGLGYPQAFADVSPTIAMFMIPEVVSLFFIPSITF